MSGNKIRWPLRHWAGNWPPRANRAISIRLCKYCFLMTRELKQVMVVVNENCNTLLICSLLFYETYMAGSSSLVVGMLDCWPMVCLNCTLCNTCIPTHIHTHVHQFIHAIIPCSWIIYGFFKNVVFVSYLISSGYLVHYKYSGGILQWYDIYIYKLKIRLFMYKLHRHMWPVMFDTFFVQGCDECSYKSRAPEGVSMRHSED